MYSEKNTETATNNVQYPGQVCPRNYMPWIWALVITSLLTIAWAVYEGSKKDGYVTKFLSKRGKAARMKLQAGEPVAAGVTVPQFQPLLQQPAASGAVGNVQNSYHGLIDAVRPAVVSIGAAVRDAATGANQGGTGPAELTFNRIGSGVIIDARGYLLTSNHVIIGAEALKATVYGPGGTKDYPVKLVKADLRSDLALLLIQGGGSFPTAPLGNSDVARTGDMVLTIGSPFGLEQSVTSGVISSRNRTLQMAGDVYENLIQTDSALNSGSSGGPMLNVNGEVIGINTAIFAPTGVFNGIGFAIPINRAADLVGGVVDFNNTAPGALSGQLVAMTTQGRQVGNNYRLPNGRMVMAPHGPLGACIDCHPQLFEQRQQAAEPAQQVALASQGRLVGNSYVLPNGLTVTPPHTLRGLCTNCHAIAFLEMRAQTALPAAFLYRKQGGEGRGRGFSFFGSSPKVFNEPVLGVGLLDVDDVICRQNRMIHPEGVYVTNVTMGGLAATGGIQPGDILIRIGGKKIPNIAGLGPLLTAQSAGQAFELVYLRNGSRLTVVINRGKWH